jgi:hypothetical protein
MSKRQSRPQLTVEQILAWADAYRARIARWPSAGAGGIPETPSETWESVNTALVRGHRGLPGGSSLAALLKMYRGGSAQTAKSSLSVEQIVAWAQAHQRRTGKWPSANSGPVTDAPSENWRALNTALQEGLRGLPGGDSLSRLRQRQESYKIVNGA